MAPQLAKAEAATDSFQRLAFRVRVTFRDTLDALGSDFASNFGFHFYEDKPPVAAVRFV